MFAKLLQQRDIEDEGSVALDVEDDDAGGGGGTHRKLWQGLPPLISTIDGLQTLYYVVFDFMKVLESEKYKK
jgi:hypothetical protein